MRASGIAPEPTELDEAMEDILERKESAEGLHEKSIESKRQEMETEKENSETVRKRALESLSETRSRDTSKRRKGGETSE